MPKKQPKPSLPIGYSTTRKNEPIGFVHRSFDKPKEQLSVDNSERHVLVAAPTGAGKGRSIIMPTLLSNDSPAVVIDIKGEAAAVTARKRMEMGHAVYMLDPFNQLTDKSDKLNPIDVIHREPQFAEDNAYMLADMLPGGLLCTRDPFWDHNAQALNSGIVAHIATTPGLENRGFGELHEMLVADDCVYELAKLLDNQGKTMNRFAYKQIAAFLQHEGEKVRTSVRSTAQQHARIFAMPSVRDAFSETTIDLDALVAGKPMTIYIIIPPSKLESHAAILRLWLTTILALLSSRKHPPAKPTLLIVDEMAQLGPMPLLKQAVTLMRGYGVRCMLFIQSLSQLRGLYPQDHETITDNCGLIFAFGQARQKSCEQLAQLIGDTSANEIMGLDESKMIAKCGKEPARILRKLDYLEDEKYEGQYDANPFHRRVRGIKRKIGVILHESRRRIELTSRRTKRPRPRVTRGGR